MLGQGVLRECLADPGVQTVRTIGRSATGLRHPKLQELVHPDLWDYSSIRGQLTGADVCFFCLGVSSAGMTEQEYARVTYDLTLAAAQTLSELNPGMTFIYVSGAGTDSTERGRTMWARVKGRTENALLRLPFRAGYMFRPGLIQPVRGVRSRTAWYRVFYALTAPLLPVARRLFPNSIVTTEELGRAMLVAARRGAPKPVLETRDIRALVEAGSPRIDAGQ